MFAISKEKEIYWAPTPYETFEECPRKLALNRWRETTDSALALGIYMHTRISSLKANPCYKSAQSWANFCVGFWKESIASKGTIRGQPIVWKSQGEAWASMPERIERMCLLHYDRFISEIPETVFFPSGNKRGKTVEYRVEPFRFQGVGFRGNIDEMRKGFIIRDYKTGLRWHLENNTEYKHQPTFYAWFYCRQAYIDPVFRARCGISDEVAQTWMGNPHFIDPRIRIEYFMLEPERKRKPDKTFETTEDGRFVYEEKDPLILTTRDNSDFVEMIEKLYFATLEKKAMDKRKQYRTRRGKHCKYCSHADACDKMTAQLPLLPVQRRFISVEDEILMQIGMEPEDIIPEFQPQQPLEAEPPQRKYKQQRFNFGRKKRKAQQPQES